MVGGAWWCMFTPNNLSQLSLLCTLTTPVKESETSGLERGRDLNDVSPVLRVGKSRVKERLHELRTQVGSFQVIRELVLTFHRGTEGFRKDSYTSVSMIVSLPSPSSRRVFGVSNLLSGYQTEFGVSNLSIKVWQTGSGNPTILLS